MSTYVFYKSFISMTTYQKLIHVRGFSNLVSVCTIRTIQGKVKNIQFSLPDVSFDREVHCV